MAGVYHFAKNKAIRRAWARSSVDVDGVCVPGAMPLPSVEKVPAIDYPVLRL